MILNIMHKVQECNRVLEVRMGLVVSIVLFPPTSLKDRVIKALELCSCGKGEKKKKKKFLSLLWHLFHHWLRVCTMLQRYLHTMIFFLMQTQKWCFVQSATASAYDRLG